MEKKSGESGENSRENGESGESRENSRDFGENYSDDLKKQAWLTKSITAKCMEELWKGYKAGCLDLNVLAELWQSAHPLGGTANSNRGRGRKHGISCQVANNQAAEVDEEEDKELSHLLKGRTNLCQIIDGSKCCETYSDLACTQSAQKLRFYIILEF